MKYINRKANVRQHIRHNKNKVSNVVHHERNIKAKQRLGVIALNNMNYKQAKKTFPGLRANGDIDHDGVKNKRDCKPFNTDMQDDAQDLIDEAEEDEVRRLKEEIRERRPDSYFQSGEDSDSLQGELDAVKQEDEEIAEQERIKEWGINNNKQARDSIW